MFDNLRQKSAEEAEFLSDDAPTMLTSKGSTKAASPGSGASRPFLGLSPSQRFMLALMLFLNVTVLGCFALLVFQKIALPF